MTNPIFIMRPHYFILGIKIIFFMQFALCSTQKIEVNARIGSVTGFVQEASFNGNIQPVVHFLGIPYAEAPIGKLRFAKTVPKFKVQSPYDATHTRPVCAQEKYVDPRVDQFEISEDCLHLNIFVPGKVVPTGKPQFAVMVWIYGGGFISGAQNYYSGEILGGFNEVIVVTINYRLSLFGYARSRGGNIPGNMGLWDQHFGIKWVHANILDFGGDPERITIFGESAGSASVLYQALYPGNKGLFKNVIAESGSPLNIWAFNGNPAKRFESIANSTGCSTENEAEVIACLNSRSTDNLMEILNKERAVDLGITPGFGPSLDGDFLKESPKDIFKNRTKLSHEALQTLGSFNLMIGMNSGEGGILIVILDMVMKHLYNSSLDDGFTPDYFKDNVLSSVIKGTDKHDVQSLVEAIYHKYTDWSDPENKWKVANGVIDFYSDYLFNVGIIQTTISHAKSTGGSYGHPTGTYLYLYDHKPSIIHSPEWFTLANHGVELLSVFGFADSLFKASYLNVTVESKHLAKPEEFDLSQMVMKLWTNFAKKGNPNEEAGKIDIIPFEWPKFDSVNQSYLHIRTVMDNESKRRRMYADRVAFWTNVIPAMEDAITQCRHENNSDLCRLKVYQEHTGAPESSQYGFVSGFISGCAALLIIVLCKRN
ncbi:hypothetical protein ACJMK2_028618 [Sinanodonta woodiana]|uniref:Carboxylic ester hydrolase n=1 Tax=Sinanodonta woodiana TaxID=1069815 RepID=A0ABD3X9E6_SINWO